MKRSTPPYPASQTLLRGCATRPCFVGVSTGFGLFWTTSRERGVVDLHCVGRSRNAQWGNDSHRGPRMGACTEATLAPHAATAAHRQPLTEPRRRHRPSPAVTGRRPLSQARRAAGLGRLPWPACLMHRSRRRVVARRALGGRQLARAQARRGVRERVRAAVRRELRDAAAAAA